MYTAYVEVIFGEDEKKLSFTEHNFSLDKLKQSCSNYILLQAKRYSMLPGEIVISLNIEKDGIYVDSEEIFAEYDGNKITIAA